MNAWLQIAGILALAAIAGVWLLCNRPRAPWDICRPLTNAERELRWIERRAHWEAQQRAIQATRRRRRDQALDQRVAQLAHRKVNA